MWSEYYRQYVSADYPRIMIRYEDMILYGKELVEVISQCSGSPLLADVVAIFAQEARSHHRGGSLIRAARKLAGWNPLLASVRGADRDYMRAVLDPALLRLFGYDKVEKCTSVPRSEHRSPESVNEWSTKGTRGKGSIIFAGGCASPQ
jgi:hypothetical protein